MQPKIRFLKNFHEDLPGPLNTEFMNVLKKFRQGNFYIINVKQYSDMLGLNYPEQYACKRQWYPLYCFLACNALNVPVRLIE